MVRRLVRHVAPTHWDCGSPVPEEEGSDRCVDERLDPDGEFTRLLRKSSPLNLLSVLFPTEKRMSWDVKRGG